MANSGWAYAFLRGGQDHTLWVSRLLRHHLVTVPDIMGHAIASFSAPGVQPQADVVATPLVTCSWSRVAGAVRIQPGAPEGYVYDVENPNSDAAGGPGACFCIVHFSF